ncbi:MAG: ArsR/SmtB family transcription factor [Paracoccaceae bacterium]
MSHLHTTFAALGNPTRFAIVERLMQEGELAAGEILKLDDISAPAMSRHFKVLRQAGIVEKRIDKQRRMYSVRPEAVQAIGAWYMSFGEFWEGSMDRLEIALLKQSRKP